MSAHTPPPHATPSSRHRRPSSTVLARAVLAGALMSPVVGGAALVSEKDAGADTHHVVRWGERAPASWDDAMLGRFYGYSGGAIAAYLGARMPAGAAV
ncbi:DUF6302 family protein [Streptomyces sp. NPDC059788]|uniref:DUF6302 family protein n=1 Tax=Streptomyces sp. NPDC059788 TaxID=3346948 RepID=UPI003649FEF2